MGGKLVRSMGERADLQILPADERDLFWIIVLKMTSLVQICLRTFQGW